MSYRHLRVFGCLAYVNVAKDQRGELDPKSLPCLFLGYYEDKFSYRMWDLVNKKVIRRWDIVFMEENTIADWEMENRSPVVDSSRVDDQQNRTSVNSTEVRYESVGRVDSRQNQELAEEQGESIERGFEPDSDEEPIEEVE